MPHGGIPAGRSMAKPAGMKTPCTGVILAGGLSRRFGGQNKALMDVGGRRIIDRLLAVYRPIFDEIIIVSNEPRAYLDLDAAIVTDIFPYRSSLTGIHAGLFHATRPYAFFAACDAPFLLPGMVHRILDAISPGVDGVVPQTAMGFEPLCAVYSRRCCETIGRRLKKQHFQIKGFFNKLRIRTLSEKSLRQQDPELRSFFNINTPDDLARAREIAASLETSIPGDAPRAF
jgi:molybdopterin-guanine dinucleotide biosynthesis protein A